MSPAGIAQLISVSASAGARGSLTLLMLASAARLGFAELPPFLEILASDQGLAALAALSAFEEFAEQDEDLQQVIQVLNLVTRGIAGSLAALSLAPETGTPEPLAGAIGFGTAAGTQWLRGRVHETLAGLGDGIHSPRTWLAYLETGGVVGLVIAVLAAPFLALGFVLAAGLAGLAALVIRRAADDRINRRSCPHCGKRARVEASICPHCRQAIPIQRSLGASIGRSTGPAPPGPSTGLAPPPMR